MSQRLKRIPTILDKLGREPTLSLANMQDIGGCRAVLDSIDEVRRVQARLLHNRPGSRVSDYITAPRSSGYRGVHVVVTYHGRRIEVQLRTRVMHEWSIAVERASGRLGQDLKGGFGDPALQGLLHAVSRVMALEEEGHVVDEAMLEEIGQLRRKAVAFLEGGT